MGKQPFGTGTGLAAILTLFLAPGLHAQVNGDIVVNRYDPGQLNVLAPDGNAKVGTVGGTGGFWLGASVTKSNLLVTTRRSPSTGINLFQFDGQEVASFDTPQVSNATGDVSVFADGTLAVNDQNGFVHYYSEAGVHVGSFNAPPMGISGAFGNFVDASDVLWVGANIGLARFDRDGTHLGTIVTGFRVGDVAVANDGTAWASDINQARVVQLDASGTVLTSFATGLNGLHYGIALAQDSTILVSVWALPDIYRFDRDGTPLGTVTLPAGSNPIFLSVLGEGPSPAVAYCTGKVNSLGCLPVIDSFGFPRAIDDKGFTVFASNVRNGKVGVLLYTLDGRKAVPFQGGTLCLAAPIRRTVAVGSGGPPAPIQNCGGGWRIDMNSFAAGVLGGTPQPGLRVPGTFVHCQWWGRDTGDAFGSALTDALQYEIAP